MTTLIDTHSHLYDHQLSGDLTGVLERAHEAGVEQVLVIGTDLANSLECIELSHRFENVFAVVGFQPNHCHEIKDGDWAQLLEKLDDEKVVGIGETGLDRYWDDCPFDLQWEWFQRHLDLSITRQLPMVVHMRDCEEDIVRFLKQNQHQWPIAGVMHSFTGCWETAELCLAAGMHISFAGMVTFKASHDLREVARRVPLDRILVETDSPYLSPEPLRGKRPNEPARVVHTARCIATTRDMAFDELCNATTANARKLFRLPTPARNDSV
ncbi:MAG: TatD family hydrolase [Pirellulaceae bacterium]